MRLPKFLHQRWVNSVYRSPMYLDQKRQAEHALRRLDNMRTEHGKLKERIHAITSALTTVTVQQRHEPFRAYRIWVEIDPAVVEQGLLQGNDDCVIEYIGQDLGHTVAHKIRQMNFERWEV